MFNQELNDKSTNKLREYCRGKRVLLVGNAASLFNHEHGELIDSYDVVVRFGKGVPSKENNKHVGSKTDVWFFGTLRASMHEQWKSARFRIFNYTQIGLYDPNGTTLSFPSCMTTDRFQIYKDYFILGDSNTHKKLISEVYPRITKENWKHSPRISQGLLCFLYFQNIIGTQASIDIIGFDFFQSTVHFEINNKKKKIYSWHLPIPVDNHENNPHGGDVEKAYIQSKLCETVRLHEMNTHIPAEVSSELVTKYRPGAIPLSEYELWTMDGCFACEITKELFNEKNIKYRERVLFQDFELEDLEKRTGGRAIPAIFVNDTYVGSVDWVEQNILKRKQ